jgi:ADP-heptose:LPS heptosyltransferase
MVEQYLEFADYLDLPRVSVSWEIMTERGDHAKIAQLLTPQHGPPVVLNVGASKLEKRWPTAYWRGLSRCLRQHWNGQVMITGGVGDRKVAREISHETHALDMSGSLSLRELTGLLAKAAIVVSCDTGPLHLAVAVGAQVIGLYGPSDPQRTGPYGQANGILVGSGGSQCRSCHRWCGDPYTPCMKSITPDMVFGKIQERLACHSSWIR